MSDIRIRRARIPRPALALQRRNAVFLAAMQILITGGTGFLGRAAALRLKADGHDVTALGRNRRAGEALVKDGIAFAAADLADRDAVAAACRGKDAVVHCAALASPWGPYESFRRANIEGTRHVLEGIARHGARRLVNISTPSIYFDYRHRTNIRETDALPEPQATHYAATKLAADGLVAKAAKSGLETIGLRPRAIFGPGDTTVLGRLLRIAEKGAVPLIDGGRSLVDLTYVDNAVDAIRLALEAPSSALDRIYNVTNGEPLSTREMLEKLGTALELDIRTRNLPFWAAYGVASTTELVHRAFRRPGEPAITKYSVGLMSRSQTLDITAAREMLGYRPNVSLDEGFRRFAVWWRRPCQRDT